MNALHWRCVCVLWFMSGKMKHLSVLFISLFTHTSFFSSLHLHLHHLSISSSHHFSSSLPHLSSSSNPFPSFLPSFSVCPFVPPFPSSLLFPSMSPLSSFSSSCSLCLLTSLSPFIPSFLPLQWRRCVLKTRRVAAAAASCQRKTRRLAPPAAWVRLPAALRISCRRVLSPAPPPPARPPPPPLRHPLRPPPRPPRLLCPGPAVWTSPAPCRCPTSASSRRCSGLAASAAERRRLNATWREVRDGKILV